MRKIKIPFWVLMVFVVFILSCQNKKQSNEGKSDIPKKEQDTVTPEKESTYTIYEDSFHGITVGSKIDLIPEGTIEKSILNTGEGDFLVYSIKSEKGEKLGYFTIEPLNKNLVGTIVITTEKARTKDNFKIGTTYKEIKSALNSFEAHGSEIESKTYVKHNNLSMRLDFPSSQYNLDKDKIPETSKIIEIQINRIISRVKNK